jgi:hypothetical protein
MKFENGAAKVNEYLKYLAAKGLLVSPLTNQWLKANAKKLSLNYDHYQKIGRTKDLNGELLVIDCSRFDKDEVQKICSIFSAFKLVFDPDFSIVNPDLILINLKSKKILVFRLGRKNRIGIQALIGEKFEDISTDQFDSYINYDFEYEFDGDEDDDPGEGVAKDPKIRYLQEFGEIDFCEITDNLYNALEGLGINAFRYASLIGNQYEVDCADDDGPDNQGNYTVDDESLTGEEFMNLKNEYKEFSEKGEKHLGYLKIFFPHLEWSDICSGAF